MPTKNLIKQAGLYTNVNTQGSYPQGAMLEASNVIIDKDDIVESRRGFKIYGDSFGSIGDTAKQLLSFGNAIIRHYDTVLDYETNNISGEFTPYTELSWKYAASGGLTSTGLVATFNSIRPHGLLNGDSVLISGATEDLYNGSFVVSVVNENTFKYDISATGESPASGNIVIETSTLHIDQIDEFNKIRGVEAPNSNFFFTSDSGIKKLDQVNNFVRQAGALKGLDLQLTAVPVENAEVLPENTQVAYRMLWGYQDLNKNLILGSPSSRTVIGLSTSDLIIPDFNSLLDKLDAAAAVNTGTLKDTNYNTLAIDPTSDAIALNAALKTLAEKLELDMNYVDPVAPRYGRELNIASTTTGNNIIVTTVDPHQLVTGAQVTIIDSNSVASIDGQYSITVTSSGSFSINVQQTVTAPDQNAGIVITGIAQNYPTPTASEDSDFQTQQKFFNDIVNDLLIESTSNIDAGAQAAANFSNATQAKTVKVTFTVPDGTTTNDLYQIYRTQASTGSNVDPGDEEGLVYEGNPTDAEIIQGFITIIDNTPDTFIGAALYTNPSQEGILQANEPPPLAKDLAVFRNIMFYANTKVRQKFQLNLLGVDNLSGTSVLIGNVTYKFASTENVQIGQVQVFTSGTPSQNLDNTARSLVKVINRYSQNTTIYAYYLSQAQQVPGQIELEARSLGVPTFYALSNSVTVGTTNFSPTIAPDNNPIVAISTGPNPTLTMSKPHGLKVTDQIILSGTNNNIDGIYSIASVTSLTVTIIRLIVSPVGTAGAFKKASSALGVSDDSVSKNTLFYSKLDEFEAVPLLNFFQVGSGDKAILRILPLRDSLFVLKEDGIYRVTGDNTTNLNLTLFDNTTNIIGSDTGAVGNNQIYTYSSQGVVIISDTGVQIISRPIENQLLPLSPNNNVKTKGFGLFYQTDRKYILFLPQTASAEFSNIAFVYNNITNAWTTWDMSKTCGVVNSRDDKLYLGATDVDFIEQERKDFDRSDHADREYNLLVTYYNDVAKIIRLSSIINAAPGDVLVQTRIFDNGPYGSFEYQVEALITAVNVLTGEVTLTTVYPFALAAVTLYKGYQCKVQWQPDTINDQGDLKHYREATLRFKKSRITQPIMGFSSDLQASVNEVMLEGIGPGLGNWGYFDWGSVPWGGDSNQRGFRTYIPIGKQRCSMLNVYFRQLNAREDWQLEGLGLIFEVTSPRINR